MKHEKIIEAIRLNQNNMPILTSELQYDAFFDENTKKLFHIRHSKAHQTNKSIIRYPFLKLY
jgi:hypothetical protein